MPAPQATAGRRQLPRRRGCLLAVHDEERRRRHDDDDDNARLLLHVVVRAPEMSVDGRRRPSRTRNDRPVPDWLSSYVEHFST